MKRSFKLELFKDGLEAVAYTVKFEDEEFSEAQKFKTIHEKEEPESFEDTYWRLKYMLDEHLFLPPMLKIQEGKRHDWVVAIKTIKPKHLRWYGLRYNDRILILGNGGIKTTDTYQQDSHLHKCVKDLQYVFRCLNKRWKRNTIIFDSRQLEIKGNLMFPVEQFYGIDYPED